VAQLSFAADKPAIVTSQREIVVPFDARRRAPRVRGATDAEPRSSEGVVVRLPLANRESRQTAPRAEETTTKQRPAHSNSNERRLTTFDFVATAFLILSVFAAPALVWTLLRSASFG
jgi:hypothetical protein